MRDRPKVGEILIQAGVIDELQLASALGEQSRWGRRIGMTLIKLGMVQEGHLVRALARQFDLPVASLAGKKIAPEVIALVPAKVACEHSVIPLFVKKEGHRELLFLGMEEPSDLGVLDDLAFRTGMMIRPVMVGPTEIGEAIDRYYTAKAAVAQTMLPDMDRAADALTETNLRRIQEEAAPTLSQLLTPSPVPEPIPAEVELESDLEVEPEPAKQVTAPVAPGLPPLFVPEAMAPPISTPAVNPVALEWARVLEETERTRLVAKAIAHLLIEKGILTLDELQARIDKLKTKPPGSAV